MLCTPYLSYLLYLLCTVVITEARADRSGPTTVQQIGRPDRDISQGVRTFSYRSHAVVIEKLLEGLCFILRERGAMIGPPNLRGT
jgi:hypothetical protein